MSLTHQPHVPDHPQQPLPWERPVYRDSHGRGLRQPLFGARIPRYRTKAGQFDGAVVAQLKRLHQAWPELVESIQCAVEDVPPSDPLPWEEHTVTRSRAFPAEHDQQARIVLYRRPIETLSRDTLDLQLLIRDELVARFADLSGKHPEDIDPDWGK
ncbi:MAG: metallopeptidase family protein [Bifidobacteriaceae bacterium]|nr:metallopeptidase family protein [Bifidobacteriaceae bacterium]